MPDTTEESYGKPFWTGTLSFGLVNVPVGLYPASRATPVSMRMVSGEGTPLQRRYFTSRDLKPLEWEDIVRGYEVAKGKFVVLDEEELDRLAPEKSGNIDLTVFVKAKELDSMYFERGYYLTPEGSNTKAYRLLATVMESEGLAGIATFVMRAKEYLVAIMAEHGILRAETLRFADDVRTPKTIGLPEPARVSAADVSRMERAIQKLAERKLDEKELVDRSAVKLLDVVEKKLTKGKDVVELPEEEKEDRADVIDLMAALEKSLKSGKAARSPRRKRRASSRA